MGIVVVVTCEGDGCDCCCEMLAMVLLLNVVVLFIVLC